MPTTVYDRYQLLVWSAASNPTYPLTRQLSYHPVISPLSNACVMLATSTFKHIFFLKFRWIQNATADIFAMQIDFKIEIYMLKKTENNMQ